MTNEINKIIQSISDFYKLDNALKYYLDRHKAQILLDCITNLQEELKETTELCSKHFVKIQALKEELKDYKSRCEKATKLLKQAGSYDEETKQFCDDVWEELPNILNTLEGSDKE